MTYTAFMLLEWNRLMLELIDTHAHLDIAEFDSQRDALLQACIERGMRGIVVPAVTRATWDNLKVVCARSTLLWPAFGLHPCYCMAHTDEHVRTLEAYLQPGVVAVGEIGLDAWEGNRDLPRQQELFAAQLAIARNARLPVVLHARKTHDLLLKEIRRQRFDCGGVVHAFSGSQQQAEKFIELGFLIGFGGGATYDRAQKLRGILRALPLSSVVLETDSPDIPPSFARGEMNTPLNLFRINHLLAEVLQIDPLALAQQTTRNAIGLFRPDLLAYFDASSR